MFSWISYLTSWVYAVYPAEDYPSALSKFAVRLAQMPSKALAGIKQAVNNSYHNNLEGQLTLERKLQADAGQTDDFKEGIAAFREKRQPKFK